jgi:biopolymer transport protein ExbB
MAAPAPAKAQAQDANPSAFKSFFAGIVIIVLFILSISIFMFVLGNPDNFEGGDTANHPIKGNYLGVVYKGGIIVPILMTFFLMVITFSIERFFTLNTASGTGSIDAFVRKIKGLLNNNNVQGAIAECDKQKGSVGNVVKSVLGKYKELDGDASLTKDQKIASLSKELEDSTALELPMLEKNLTIIATLASVATLVGLLGTVLGMIKAFSALVNAGAPDTAALSTGISEALINTALGIGTSACAIISYNFFTSKIDTLTYSIDEVGFSIMQNFGSKN